MSERKSHKKVYIIGGIAAAFMFAFCFAMVPLYSMICSATGLNTSAPSAQLVTPAQVNQLDKTADTSRDITVQFVAMEHMGLPWDFYPRVKSVQVHPGQNAKVFFFAKNTTDRDMTVQAIPAITPTDAIAHFHKLQCFCFTQQSLKAHQGKEMPLIFHVDKDLPQNIRVITLAYTLFEVAPKDIKKG